MNVLVWMKNFFPSGNQCYRAGLPPAPTPWLPYPSAPADAGLLAEGPLGTSSLRGPRQCSGQADPKPGITENSRSGRSRVRAWLCLVDWQTTCPIKVTKTVNIQAGNEQQGKHVGTFYKVSLCPSGILPISGQTLASYCPILCTNLMSCCDLSASCCSHFPSSTFCLSAGHIQERTLHPWQIPLFVPVSHSASDYASACRLECCCRIYISTSLLFEWPYV